MKVENKVTVGTWLPIFTGFYDTVFQSTDDYLEECLKDSNLLSEKEIDEVNRLNCYNEAVEEYELATVKDCICEIKNKLSNRFITAIEYERTQSPKEYNYVNDSVDIEVMLTDDNVTAIKDFISDNKSAWIECLKSHYTSCDGFISSYSNKVEDWEIDYAILDSHKLGRILDFILRVQGFNEIELYESIDSNSLYIAEDDIIKELIEDGFYDDKPELIARHKKIYDERDLARTNRTIFELIKKRG